MDTGSYQSLLSDIELFIEKNNYPAIFLLADKTVFDLYPDFFANIFKNKKLSVFTMQSDEQHKSIEQAEKIWKEMLSAQLQKDTLFINWGGGVVSDIGGFVAATYKRGIDYINIPTTLLSMIDAAIGGKTAINANDIKNCIGSITLPKKVFVSQLFLDTLPQTEILSGFGELMKYALIGNADLWIEIAEFEKIERSSILTEWILFCKNYKENITFQDLYDNANRRLLNFGHTIGHAFESLAMHKKQNISHGHAIALGMICEAYISVLQGLLPKEKALEIKNVILRHFPLINISENDHHLLMQFINADKKNCNNCINITLLEEIGKGKINGITNDKEIEDALSFLKNQ